VRMDGSRLTPLRFSRWRNRVIYSRVLHCFISSPTLPAFPFTLPAWRRNEEPSSPAPSGLPQAGFPRASLSAGDDGKRRGKNRSQPGYRTSRASCASWQRNMFLRICDETRASGLLRHRNIGFAVQRLMAKNLRAIRRRCAEHDRIPGRILRVIQTMEPLEQSSFANLLRSYRWSRSSTLTKIEQQPSCKLSARRSLRSKQITCDAATASQVKEPAALGGS